MLFLNPLLLIGLLGISVPIILHIFNRKSAKPVDWGAMRFLVESVASRTRRIELEDALLMAARCLVVGCLALALARPFSPPGSLVPWAVVLPALLLAIAALGVACALWSNRKRRWVSLGVSAVLFALVIAAVLFERAWNLRRLGGGGDQDVALIIDASTSMGAQFAERSVFDRAVQEAREIINGSGRSTAFSLILAGPSARVLNPYPTRSRDDLERLLAGARPSDGAMSVTGALRAAAVQLDKGERGGQRIVLLTDGQAHGWDADNSAAWGFANEGFAEMTDRPQLVLRRLDVPAEVRNLAITAIGYSRDAVGTDRPVEIEVALENTGTEAVTPGGVQLRVGEDLLEDNSLGQLVPGMRQTVRFSHHFKTAGAHALTARALVDDHIAADNALSSALTVTAGLKVLIVDGNPGGRYFDRASAFLELALAPGMTEGASAMITPVVLPAPQILSLTSFDEYDAVVLADVQRLPASSAALLAAWVESGGGLLITPGKRAEPEFYNEWQAGPGAPVTPAALVSMEAAAADATIPVTPSPGTFDHRALRKAADAKNGDLASTRITNYWILRMPEAEGAASAVAKLNNGEPLLALRQLGSGTVMMSALPFDNTASNLATRNSFLPLVHELIYFLAAPEGGLLNLPPAPELAVRLPAEVPEGQARYGVLDPRGDTRAAELKAGAGGLLAQIPGDAMAGLYEMEIPAPARAGFTGLLSAAGTVPFTVARPPQEASLTPLTGPQLAKVTAHFEVLQARETADVLTILAGKSFGEELWRYLALGALLLLIGEAALARWIARTRKTGASENVEFTSRRGPGEAFQKQLSRVRDNAA